MLSRRQLAAINLKKRGDYDYALSMKEKRDVARDPLKKSVPLKLRLGMIADTEPDEEMISDDLPKDLRRIAKRLYAPSKHRSRSKRMDFIYEMADNAGWKPGDTTEFLLGGALKEYLWKKKAERKKRGGELKSEDLVLSQFLKPTGSKIREETIEKRAQKCEECGGTLKWMGGELVCTGCGLVADDMPLATGSVGKEIQEYPDK